MRPSYPAGFVFPLRSQYRDMVGEPPLTEWTKIHGTFLRKTGIQDAPLVKEKNLREACLILTMRRPILLLAYLRRCHADADTKC
jgi:hypothetical protein